MQELLLSDLPRNKTGVIQRFATADVKTKTKLMALGLIPGQKVTVYQQYPQYVIALDNTLLGLDSQIASQIIVETN